MASFAHFVRFLCLVVGSWSPWWITVSLITLIKGYGWCLKVIFISLESKLRYFQFFPVFWKMIIKFLLIPVIHMYHMTNTYIIQSVHEILCFFPRIFNILRPCLRQHWAAIGCAVNGQPIIVTVHSDLRSDELLSYMQGMGCSELGKKTIFNMNTLYINM